MCAYEDKYWLIREYWKNRCEDKKEKEAGNLLAISNLFSWCLYLYIRNVSSRNTSLYRNVLFFSFSFFFSAWSRFRPQWMWGGQISRGETRSCPDSTVVSVLAGCLGGTVGDIAGSRCYAAWSRVLRFSRRSAYHVVRRYDFPEKLVFTPPRFRTQERKERSITSSSLIT